MKDMDNQPLPPLVTLSRWNQVTPLSKYLAMALFVIMPFAGFVIGMRYTYPPVASVTTVEYEVSHADVNNSKEKNLSEKLVEDVPLLKGTSVSIEKNDGAYYSFSSSDGGSSIHGIARLDAGHFTLLLTGQEPPVCGTFPSDIPGTLLTACYEGDVIKNRNINATSSDTNIVKTIDVQNPTHITVSCVDGHTPDNGTYVFLDKKETFVIDDISPYSDKALEITLRAQRNACNENMQSSVAFDKNTGEVKYIGDTMIRIFKAPKENMMKEFLLAQYINNYNEFYKSKNLKIALTEQEKEELMNVCQLHTGEHKGLLTYSLFDTKSNTRDSPFDFCGGGYYFHVSELLVVNYYRPGGSADDPRVDSETLKLIEHKNKEE